MGDIIHGGHQNCIEYRKESDLKIVLEEWEKETITFQLKFKLLNRG